MNLHIIHGRLVRDPEYIQDDRDEKKDRTKFTVATDRRYGDEADFHDCIVFGKRAKVIDKYFSKGSEILVFGEDQGRSYEDKNGVKRKSWTLVVSDFDFCGSARDNSARAQEANRIEQAAKDLLMPSDSFDEQEADMPF